MGDWGRGTRNKEVHRTTTACRSITNGSGVLGLSRSLAWWFLILIRIQYCVEKDLSRHECISCMPTPVLYKID